jgi:hypothetical protein
MTELRLTKQANISLRTADPRAPESKREENRNATTSVHNHTQSPKKKKKKNYYFKTLTSDPFIYTPPRSTTINKAKTMHMHGARDVVHILPRISSPSKRLHNVLNSWKHRLSPPASK